MLNIVKKGKSSCLFLAVLHLSPITILSPRWLHYPFSAPFSRLDWSIVVFVPLQFHNVNRWTPFSRLLISGLFVMNVPRIMPPGQVLCGSAQTNLSLKSEHVELPPWRSLYRCLEFRYMILEAVGHTESEYIMHAGDGCSFSVSHVCCTRPWFYPQV